MVKMLILFLLIIIPLAFGGSFTAVGPEDDFQQVGPHSELLLSWNERRQAIGQAALAKTNYAAGDDIQWSTNYSMIQDWMEYNCGSFINTEVPQTNGIQFVYWDLTTFRQAAGFTNGFRKALSSTAGVWTFTNGNAAVGDPLGWWLVTDLQNGFKKLVKTGGMSTDKTNCIAKSVHYEYRTNDWNYVKSEMAAYWAAASESTNNDPASCRNWQIYAASGYIENDDGPTPPIYRLDAYRAQSKPVYMPLYTGVQHTASIYMYMTNYYGNSFLDIDQLGTPVSKMWYMETLAKSANAREMGSTIGAANWSTDPINQYPLPDPGPGVISNDGISVREQIYAGPVANWLIDWDFTYK